MDNNFELKVKLALTGEVLATLPHMYKRGYYVSDFKVNDQVTFELMHKGKKVPTSVNQVYAIREKLNIEK